MGMCTNNLEIYKISNKCVMKTFLCVYIFNRYVKMICTHADVDSNEVGKCKQKLKVAEGFSTHTICMNFLSKKVSH